MKSASQGKKRRLGELLAVALLMVVSPLVSGTIYAQGGKVGQAASNFRRVDLNNKKIELASYGGKVVLLNFWATWCAPCLTEMPVFAAWQREYGADKLQVIGVSMGDAAPAVVATVAKLKLDYPVLMGDEHIGAAYGGVMGLPVTFLIGRDGRIRKRYQGVDVKGMKGDIENLLHSR
jgi:cytochrome c biogenesis protein CcmG/thiol:disulfide interchange protein DsbE